MESIAGKYYPTRRRLSSASESGRSAFDDTYDLALLPSTRELDISRGPVSESIRSTLREIKEGYRTGTDNCLEGRTTVSSN